jgi:outer membrane receptor protein involved in Fe transport
MKKKLFFLILFFPFILQAQLNGTLLLSGKVVGENHEPVPSASISIKGTKLGTVTDSTGKFSLVINQKLPFRIVISSLGFTNQEIEVKSSTDKLAIQLTTQTYIANEVVVTASRTSEKLMRSPVSIEKLDLRALKETPAASFYDALGNVKGIQLTTSSLTFKIPNARGFNIPNNFRFMQLVDGVDMQAATLGVPLGNAIGPTELDIQSIEITPGAASALYGMNAINGMANLITKNPFTNQGLSVFQRVGVNHVDGIDHAPSMLTETALRYAQAFNKKFAFKFNFGYMRGTDWSSNTQSDQNPNSLNTANPAYPALNGSDNPAADLWNRYGDESNNAVTINGVNYNGGNKTFILRRTGYLEKDLIKPIVDNLKFDLSFYYKLTPNTELSYGYRFGKMDGVFQRGNKVQLDNVIVQNHKLELKGKNFFVRAYVSLENTGDSYNLKPLADNLQLTQSSNSIWGAKFKSVLQSSLNAGQDLASAMKFARAAADLGRVEPGTPAFDALRDTIIKINNWDHLNAGIAGAPSTGGAWLLQKSRMYQTEAQWDLTNTVKFLNLLVGADYRLYEVIPDGNNFVDFSRPVTDRNKPLADGSFGNNVLYRKYGAFAQVTKTFFDDHLKLFGSIRYDQNPEFSPKINPRVAAVYTVAKNHNFRVSYQNGFRFPSLFEALSFVNNGGVRRVGGLSYINQGLGYLENSYTLSSINNFNAAVNTDVTAGITANAAALKNRALLEVTDLATTRPERINSFEAGYKSSVLNNKLVIDFDAYYNVYDGFLGQVDVSVPENNAVQVGTDAAVLDMLASNRSKQTRYRVFTNAKNQYTNYGSALGLSWNFYKTFSISGNINYNTIKQNTTTDVFVTGFNTPKWGTNIAFGNREIARNFGFNMVWKWQDAYLWESPLVNGAVSAYNTVDAQVTLRVPSLKATIKLGGSNIFNNRYFQYAGGPTIGALYYTAITLDGLLNK